MGFNSGFKGLKKCADGFLNVCASSSQYVALMVGYLV